MPRSPEARNWARLPDAELLQLRFRDLGLKLAGTPLARRAEPRAWRAASGAASPSGRMWLSEEWFSPDGVPGIAVPFYLAHPRLAQLERHMMRQVEGGNGNWMMRILRHEVGHAIDTAYRLRRRARWREVFGPGSLPYPEELSRAARQPQLRAAPGRVVRAVASHRGFRRDFRRVAETQLRLAPHLCELAGLGKAAPGG